MPWGTSIYVKISATNLVGESDYSAVVNGATILTQPDPPITLANDASITDMTNIGLTWADPVENGGTAIIDYIVSYDQGTDTYISLASNVLTKTYTATTLTPDLIYKFKVQATNAFGTSLFSNEVSIRAARVPDAPVSLANNVPVTSASQVGLTWNAGTSNGGSAITDYEVWYDAGVSVWEMLA